MLHANTLAGKAATQAALERGYDLIQVSQVPWKNPPKNSFVLDTCDPKVVRDLAHRLEKNNLQVEILITCPAFNAKDHLEDNFKAFEEFEMDHWNRIIRENLNAQMLFCKFFGKGMRERGKGRILQLANNVALDPDDPRHLSSINSGSSSAHAPAAYACAMAGIMALTRSLAADHMNSGVLINSLVFGLLEESVPESLINAYKKRVPLGRVMSSTDLKNALDVFLDPESLYITGQSLIADGGVSIW